jgi:hypothetical protein
LKITRYLGFTVGLSLLFAASAASAQGREFEPESQENRIGLEFDWHHTVASNAGATNVLTWDLFFQIGVSPRLFLDIDIPWALASFPLARDRGAFGNPLVGLHYADSISKNLSFFVGGGLGIPVNADPSSVAVSTDLYIASTRAYSGFARFAPRAFPLLFRGGLEVSAAPFFARFDLAPTFLIALNGGADTSVLLEQGNEIGLRARYGLLGGLRLQANFILTDTLIEGSVNLGDQAQLALEPFIGYEANRAGLFLRFGLLFALDENLGFGFNRGKISNARFTIGGKF